MARNNSDSSGCGCLILIILAIVFFVNKCNEPKADKTASIEETSSAYQYSQAEDTQVEDVERELSEEK